MFQGRRIRNFNTSRNRKCRILISSASNTGSSSLVNLFSSDEQEVVNVARAREMYFGQCTTRVTEYEAGDNVVLIDSYSFIKPSGQSNLRDYDRIVCGRYSPENDANENEGFDCVIFLIDGLVCINSPDTIDSYVPFVDSLRKSQTPFIFGVTKVDLLSQNVDGVNLLHDRSGRAARERFIEGELWRGIRGLIREKMSIVDEEVTSIVPVINYTPEDMLPNDVITHFARVFAFQVIKTIEDYVPPPRRRTPNHDYYLLDRINFLRNDLLQNSMNDIPIITMRTPSFETDVCCTFFRRFHGSAGRDDDGDDESRRSGRRDETVK